MRAAFKQRVLIFLLCIHVGNVKANSFLTEIKTEFLKGMNVVSSYKTLSGYSKLRCVNKCLAEATDGLCKAAGYDTSTKTCFLSSENAVANDGPHLGAFVLITKGNLCYSEFYRNFLGHVCSQSRK